MTSPTINPPSAEQVTRALDGVQDPEIHRPITELGMVKNVAVAADGAVLVEVYLTVAGCPMRDTLTPEVTAAVRELARAPSGPAERGVSSEGRPKALRTALA